MTLNQIATTVGNTSFLFKSSVTGKKFKVVSVTPKGKFVVENMENTNESLLDGQVDRYEVVPSGPSVTELRLTELRNKVESLENSISSLQDDLDEVLNEINDLESEDDVIPF